jgi:biotin transporter BioY
MVGLLLYLLSFVVAFCLIRFALRKIFSNYGWGHTLVGMVISLIPIMGIGVGLILVLISIDWDELPEPPKWL